MTPPRKIVDTDEEQLALWVRGEGSHVIVRPKKLEPFEQCCPDFSCCRPELQQPVEIREAFAAADTRTRQSFLMSFLGALVEAAEKSDAIKPGTAIIAGKDPREES